MPFAVDGALFIDMVAPQRHHFAGYRHICVWQPDSIELQLQISFTPKVARLAGRFQMPFQIAAARKGDAAKLLHAAQMAENRIAYIGGSGREVRFIHGAAEQGTRRHEDFLGSDALFDPERQQ